MTGKQIRLIVRMLRGRNFKGLKAAKAGDVSLAMSDPASRRFSVRSLAESRWGSALEEGQAMRFRVARQGKEIGNVRVYVHPGAESATLNAVMPTVRGERVGPFTKMVVGGESPQRELDLGVAGHLRMLRNIRQAIPPSVKKVIFVRQPFGDRGRYRTSSVKLR